MNKFRVFFLLRNEAIGDVTIHREAFYWLTVFEAEGDMTTHISLFLVPEPLH